MQFDEEIIFINVFFGENTFVVLLANDRLPMNVVKRRINRSYKCIHLILNYLEKKHPRRNKLQRPINFSNPKVQKLRYS